MVPASIRGNVQKIDQNNDQSHIKHPSHRATNTVNANPLNVEAWQKPTNNIEFTWVAWLINRLTS